MISMLTPRGMIEIMVVTDSIQSDLFSAVNSDGTITAEVSNPAVTQSLLKELLYWKTEHCTDRDIIGRLRPRTVPTGYEYTTWYPGK